ncbi:MAG: glycine--tRNA ligase subunit beta, partial [Candidatus Omnitrophica bacterium]|nr:glycine--tRNA ligase subunit beta [Candidatus Omnitrophota bacterium]
MQTVNFLIELGFEEIPSGLIGSVASQLESNFSQALEDNSVACKKICSYASPVRVVLAGEISRQNSPRQTEVKGPSYSSAYDKQGNLTAAARGFLKSQGVEESDVFIQDTEKGKYFSVRKREQSKLSSQVIKDILPSIISKVSLPKYMSWDNSGLKFARPLRSVIVIWKDEVLKFKLANLESSSSVSVRDGAVYKQFKVKTVKSYFALIKKEGIILSLPERKNKISSILNKEASRFYAGVALNEQLLEEVANIVERPAVVCCDFESRFLKLPEIVLLASMAKYQRVFALYGGNKNIINKFLAVVENRPANAAGIKKHYEF